MLHYAPTDFEIAKGARPFTRCGLCIFPGIKGAGRHKQANICWLNTWEHVDCRNCLSLHHECDDIPRSTNG